MKVDITEEGQVTVLSINGRMDATTTNDFDEAVKGLDNLDRKKILVDLDKLEFISSAGLRSFLILAKTCQKNEVKLAFCTLNKMVSEVFNISGLNSIFTIHTDKLSALASW